MDGCLLLNKSPTVVYVCVYIYTERRRETDRETERERSVYIKYTEKQGRQPRKQKARNIVEDTDHPCQVLLGFLPPVPCAPLSGTPALESPVTWSPGPQGYSSVVHLQPTVIV